MIVLRMVEWRKIGGRYWWQQVLRALSHLLNGLTGGEGDCSYSAWSYERLRRGEAGAAELVAWVDGLPFNGPGHCARAWEWHRQRGRLEREESAAV